jgi:hypothetical protein
MHYVIQHNLFKEYGFKSLIEHLDRNELSYDIVRYIPFSKQLLDTRGEWQVYETERKDVFFFGYANAGEAIKPYNWKPGHLLNENFTFEKYLLMYGKFLLNSDGAIITHSSMVLNETFIRPLDDGKAFTGEVFRWDAWRNYIKDNEAFDDDSRFFAASPKNPIQQEIRCWMVGGKAVTISQYKIGSRVNYLNMDNNEEAILFAEKMAKIYSPAEAFCLDICLYEDEYRIVEIGCINHCGFYDANMSKLIQALEAFYTPKSLL